MNLFDKRIVFRIFLSAIILQILWSFKGVFVALCFDKSIHIFSFINVISHEKRKIRNQFILIIQNEF